MKNVRNISKPLAVLMLFIGLSFIVGCASLAAPKTVDDNLVYAAAGITAINNSAASMLERGRIDKQSAIKVLEQSGEAQALLNIARIASSSGDSGAATEALSSAQGIILSLEEYLRQKENPQ